MTALELIEIQDRILKSISTKNRFNLYLLFSIHKRADYLEGNKAYILIQTALIEAILLDLVKLLDPNQAFSFNRVFSMNPFSDVSITKTINRSEIRKLRQDLRGLQCEYKKLKIEEIRNEYLAHLDESGNEYKLTTTQIQQLIDKTQNFFNSLLNTLFDRDFDYEKLDSEIDKFIKVITQHEWITSAVKHGIRDKTKNIEFQALRNMYKMIK